MILRETLLLCKRYGCIARLALRLGGVEECLIALRIRIDLFALLLGRLFEVVLLDIGKFVITLFCLFLFICHDITPFFAFSAIL